MELVRLVQIVYRRCRMANSVITCTQCSIVIKSDWSLLSCYVHLYLYNKNYIETFQAVARTSVSVGVTFTGIIKVTHDNVLLYLVVHSLTPKFPSFIPSASVGMYPWPLIRRACTTRFDERLVSAPLHLCYFIKTSMFIFSDTTSRWNIIIFISGHWQNSNGCSPYWSKSLA